MRIRTLRHPVTALIALVLTLALAGTAGVTAQGTTTPLDLSGAIAQGTCDAPGQASIQVGDFIRIDESEVVGSQEIEFTLRTQRNVDSTLDALFGPTPHVFIVADNADPSAGPVACGALGGVAVPAAVLLITSDPSSPATFVICALLLLVLATLVARAKPQAVSPSRTAEGVHQ